MRLLTTASGLSLCSGGCARGRGNAGFLRRDLPLRRALRVRAIVTPRCRSRDLVYAALRGGALTDVPAAGTDLSRVHEYAWSFFPFLLCRSAERSCPEGARQNAPPSVAEAGRYQDEAGQRTLIGRRRRCSRCLHSPPCCQGHCRGRPALGRRCRSPGCCPCRIFSGYLSVQSPSDSGRGCPKGR